eukprot:286397-Prymnesium_polylepis.1
MPRAPARDGTDSWNARSCAGLPWCASAYASAAGALMRPAPCANGSSSIRTAEFSRARRSSMGPTLRPCWRSAESTHAATPQALGELMDVPWYCALPWSVWRGTGAMAPPGAQRLGRRPSGVGPREEKE